MNQYRNITTAALLFLSTCLQGQEPKGYTITGKIKGLPEGDKVTLKLFFGKSFFDCTVFDSTYVKDGEFHFKGIVPDGPRLFWMEFASIPDRDIPFIFDNGEAITITNPGDKFVPSGSMMRHSVIIEGSPTNHGYDCLIPLLMTYSQSIGAINSTLRKCKDSVGFDRAYVQGLVMAKQCLNQALYAMVLSTNLREYKYGIPFFMYDRLDELGHTTVFADAYNRIDEKTKGGFYGKKLKQYVSLCEGQIFPDFSLPDATNKPLALKELLPKGKLTLVHFWTSNSWKRKEYQEELSSLYKQYHEKGLTIIGVSGDVDTAGWKFWVQSGAYPWYNVHDSRGMKSVVEEVYHEFTNPDMPNTTNVLVNPEGKIVAWDPTGAELQWYLWKYLDGKQ